MKWHIVNCYFKIACHVIVDAMTAAPGQIPLATKTPNKKHHRLSSPTSECSQTTVYSANDTSPTIVKTIYKIISDHESVRDTDSAYAAGIT